MIKQKGEKRMKTKYDIGETVLVEYAVKRIYADDKGIKYELQQTKRNDSQHENHEIYLKEPAIYGPALQNVQKPNDEYDGEF